MGRLEQRVTALEAYRVKDETEKSVATKAGRAVMAAVGILTAIAGAIAGILHLSHR